MEFSIEDGDMQGDQSQDYVQWFCFRHTYNSFHNFSFLAKKTCTVIRICNFCYVYLFCQLRVLGAQHLIQTLKTHKKVKDILTQMEVVATALISLAYHEVQEKSKRKLLKCLIPLCIKTTLNTCVMHGFLLQDVLKWCSGLQLWGVAYL